MEVDLEEALMVVGQLHVLNLKLKQSLALTLEELRGLQEENKQLRLNEKLTCERNPAMRERGGK